jgi:carbon-monoxide dehydrogenase catalytic subunit
MTEGNKRSADPATQEMIVLAGEAGMATPWDRLADQKKQCRFGVEGLCCKNCFMGPCRVNPGGKGAQVGICGATADTIVARNLLRSALSGGAAHSDHGREIIHALALAAEGKSPAYKIKCPEKLRSLAREYEIAEEGRTDNEVAAELAHFLLGEFGKQEGVLANVARAPEQQQKNWAALDVTPRGVDR